MELNSKLNQFELWGIVLMISQHVCEGKRAYFNTLMHTPKYKRYFFNIYRVYLLFKQYIIGVFFPIQT